MWKHPPQTRTGVPASSYLFSFQKLQLLSPKTGDLFCFRHVELHVPVFCVHLIFLIGHQCSIHLYSQYLAAKRIFYGMLYTPTKLYMYAYKLWQKSDEGDIPQETPNGISPLKRSATEWVNKREKTTRRDTSTDGKWKNTVVYTQIHLNPYTSWKTIMKLIRSTLKLCTLFPMYILRCAREWTRNLCS